MRVGVNPSDRLLAMFVAAVAADSRKGMYAAIHLSNLQFEIRTWRKCPRIDTNRTSTRDFGTVREKNGFEIDRLLFPHLFLPSFAIR